jgi:hypothetical protein
MVDNDSSDLTILKAENCPKDLKKRLWRKAIDDEIDLQDLVLRFCREGLERAELESDKNIKRKPK